MYIAHTIFHHECEKYDVRGGGVLGGGGQLLSIRMYIRLVREGVTNSTV